MNLLFLFIGILAVFIIFAVTVFKRGYEDLGILFGILSIIPMLGLVISLVMIPVGHTGCSENVERYKALQQTLNTIRAKQLPGYENATIARDITEFNTDLAGAQYYANNPWFSVFYTDEFRALKPIQ